MHFFRLKARADSSFDCTRTKLLIFSLAMFRVRPGLNWMLIAGRPGPYIRPALSPSLGRPPFAERASPYPHVLCSAGARANQRERASPPLPLGRGVSFARARLETRGFDFDFLFPRLPFPSRFRSRLARVRVPLHLRAGHPRPAPARAQSIMRGPVSRRCLLFFPALLPNYGRAEFARIAS